MDLVISDVLMPTLDGARFHSYVREFTANCDIPFIFMSGAVERGEGLIVDPARDFFVSKTAPVEKVLGLVESLAGAGAALP